MKELIIQELENNSIIVCKDGNILTTYSGTLYDFGSISTECLPKIFNKLYNNMPCVTVTPDDNGFAYYMIHKKLK